MESRQARGGSCRPWPPRTAFPRSPVIAHASPVSAPSPTFVSTCLTCELGPSGRGSDLRPSSVQVALVQWTESVGLTLVGRDQSSMQLRTPGDQILNFTILQIFPFTYESKRMGIIVRVSPAALN